MQLPVHPYLLVLRSVVTLELSLLIGQAGWAAAGLGDDAGYFGMHAHFSLPTLIFGLINAVCYIIWRRTAGAVCLALAVLLAVMLGAQYALGEAHLRAVHIFFGVLTVMVATALTSWTYRLPSHSIVSQQRERQRSER